MLGQKLRPGLQDKGSEQRVQYSRRGVIEEMLKAIELLFLK
jgi:hypothetical protein